MTVRVLRKSDIADEIRAMKNGAEALDLLFGQGAYTLRTGSPPPEVVWLDAQVPTIGGLEVLKHLRAKGHATTLPVVIPTSSDEPRGVIQGCKLGTNR